MQSRNIPTCPSVRHPKSPGSNHGRSAFNGISRCIGYLVRRSILSSLLCLRAEETWERKNTVSANEQLNVFLSPKSVAVIGATERPGSWGSSSCKGCSPDPTRAISTQSTTKPRASSVCPPIDGSRRSFTRRNRSSQLCPGDKKSVGYDFQFCFYVNFLSFWTSFLLYKDS